MTRAVRFAIIGGLFTTLYILLYLSIVSLPLISEELQTELIPVVPWWLLVSFGAYSLASLGWGLFTFKECPEAYHELLREITEANNDLRKKGVSVD